MPILDEHVKLTNVYTVIIMTGEMKTAQTTRRRGDHRTRVGRERSARTETRILEAALGVFADMGPDAPKIDDFVLAAGISRGTFYNYFESVEELLAATSEWTTRELIETIERALEGIEGPALRFGVGLRLFFAKAKADPVWCRFVARVWKVGGVELPARDLEGGLRLGVFRAPSSEVARDLLFGGIRQALVRIGGGRAHASYGAQMTELCLQALGTDARRIAAVMSHELPRLPSGASREDAGKKGTG
jgi:AcrR family transcriptional regulator